jgi:hypothetical protein
VTGRLIAWCGLVAALSATAYTSRAVSGKPPKDVLYQWGAVASGLFELGLVLGIVLLICTGRSKRELLALRRPRSWRRAGLLAAGILVATYIVSAVLNPFLHPGREQGLTPHGWDSTRAAPFIANFIVIAVGAPVVEELTFRGLGYSLLAPFGPAVAIIAVGLAFGLAHGLVEALPILVLFGCGLAYLRSQTDSVYPGMLVHGFFNAVALLAAVLT